MKKLNLNIDYKFPVEEKSTKKDIENANAELTRDYIAFAITSSYAKGLSSQFRRLYVKIQSKIDTALNTKDYVIELEDGEFNFIKEAFSSDDCKVNATIAKYFVVLEDEILSI